MKRKFWGVVFLIETFVGLYLMFDDTFTKGELSGKLVALLISLLSAFIAYKLLSKPKEKSEVPVKVKKESKKEIRLKNDINKTLDFMSSDEKVFTIPAKMDRKDLIKVFEDNTDKTVSSSLGGLFLNNSFIAVDDTKNLFYIGNNMHVYKYHFSKLANFEYFENGNVIVSGKTLATVAGGLTFGVLGAIAGSSGKRKQINEINDVSLKIYLNDLNNPQITMALLSKKSKTNSSLYQTAKINADEMLGVLNYIKNKEVAL